MTYREEDAIRERIVNALRDAFPDRAADMADQVTRWFTRHWRNLPAEPVPEGQRCRLCDLSRRARSFTSGDVRDDLPLCTDCVRDAHRLASDDRYPSRDLVRMEALRALRAEGMDEAARFVEQLASAFPDLVREEGTCSRCTHVKPVVRGMKTRLCAACLGVFRSEFGVARMP